MPSCPPQPIRPDEQWAEYRAKRDGFRKRYYPGVPLRQWNDWHWQWRNRIRTEAEVSRLLTLQPQEKEAFAQYASGFPFAITPYYASLMDPAVANDPLRRTVVPRIAEHHLSKGESTDPLGENPHSPVPGIVHTYPDKVLFLVIDRCATYCRFCTRSRRIGAGELRMNRRAWEKALQYIVRTPTVRDVLLSGGDPLLLSDDQLLWLLEQLRAIPHVEFLRIGTKIPIVMPQRITPALTRMLRRFHPLFISLHVTHPQECTPECARACARLADAGIPLGSQTVLLAEVNDDPDIMRKLMHTLLRMRVKPYYLHQCDAVSGSAHFRTPLARGREIIRSLHGHTTGYAVPTYMLDAPGGGGKVPLTPDYCTGREGPWYTLHNYQGAAYRYYDPTTP